MIIIQIMSTPYNPESLYINIAMKIVVTAIIYLLSGILVLLQLNFEKEETSKLTF